MSAQTTTSAFSMDNFTISADDLEKALSAAEEKYQKDSSYINARSSDLMSENSLTEKGSLLYVSIPWIIFFLPLVFIIIISSTSFMDIDIAWISSCVWIGIYLFFGLRQIPQTEVWLISRFGIYIRDAKKGLHLLCLPGLIDTIDAKVELSEQSSGIYDHLVMAESLAENDNKIDFLDGSAGINCVYRFRISNPAKFTYSAVNNLGEVESIMEGLLRPLLQRLNIDSANIHKSLICSSVLSWVQDEMKDLYGIQVSRLQILDIILTPEIQETRLKRLQAQTDAQATAAGGAGIANALAALIQQAKQDTGEEMTMLDAMSYYKDMEAMRTVREADANITFVAPGIEGVIGTFGVGSNKNKDGGSDNA